MDKYIRLRDVDDKIIKALKELDESLSFAIEHIVSKHPKFIIDFLIGTTYMRDITAGGVRVFSGSRKKRVIKYKLLNLIALVDSPKNFLKKMDSDGLIRGVKEKLVYSFFDAVRTSYLDFTLIYGDPFPTYKLLYASYNNYVNLRNSIVRITFNTLSKIILTSYSGWEKKRSFSSPTDYCDFEEDVQNSSFSISKAITLFDTSQHKSFFSYVTGWIKEGISSCDFTLTDSDGNSTIKSPYFVSIEEIFRTELSESDGTTKEYYISDIPSTYLNPEEELIYSDDQEEDICASQFLQMSMPLPTELRIFYRILQNLQ